MTGENKVWVVGCAMLMLSVVLPFWLVQSNQTARSCLVAKHPPSDCSIWGGP